MPNQEDIDAQIDRLLIYRHNSIGYFNARRVIQTLKRESEDFHSEFKESIINKIISNEISRTLNLYGQFSTIINHHFAQTSLLASLSTEKPPSIPWGQFYGLGFFSVISAVNISAAIAAGTFPPLAVLGGIALVAVSGFNIYNSRADNERDILSRLDSFSEQYKSDIINLRPLIADMLKKAISTTT